MPKYYATALHLSILTLNVPTEGKLCKFAMRSACSNTLHYHAFIDTGCYGVNQI